MRNKNSGKILFRSTVIFFLGSFLFCSFAGIIFIDSKMNAEKLIMENLIAEKSRMVGEALLRLLYKTQAVSVIALRKYEQDELNQVAAMIIDDPVIANILIAKDGVVNYVYPLDGNEAVIGLDFFSEGAGNREAVMAKESRQLVIGGPFNAVQGGQVIVGRLPVFISEPSGGERFWGLVSITLRYPQVLDSARLDELHSQQEYDYEIWRINPDNNERQIIFGSSYARETSLHNARGTPLHKASGKNTRYIEKQYNILNAEWNYRMFFRHSWYEYKETWFFLLGALCISLTVAAVIQKKNRAMFEQTVLLSEEEERIRLMLDTSPLCCQIIAENFKTIDCNEAAAKLYGYANKQEYINNWDKECMPEYQPNGRLTREVVWEYGLKAIKDGYNFFEIMHQTPDGTPLPAEVTLVRVNYMGNEVVIAYTRDLRDIKKLEVKAEEINYDALTGIFNRRYFNENLERTIKSLSRACGMLSLMMVDIDFFKNYNDTYGHCTGDNCLISIAAALTKNMAREGDFVARYGGEEFAVVMPNTGEDGARFLADKLLESIRKLAILHENSNVANFVTISIGVTTGSVRYTQKAMDYVNTADKALYMSKQSGRNRYTFIGFEDITNNQ